MGTVGTALVLSGTVATATIPVAGGIGYVASHYSQRTDGCIPAEYEEKESDDVNTKAQGMAVAQIARDWCTPNGANHYVWGGWSVGPKDDYDPKEYPYYEFFYYFCDSIFDRRFYKLNI